MKELFKKIGLIKEFEIRFPIENDKVIELLKSDKNDITPSLYNKIFAKENPFNSTDFAFDKVLNEFSTNRESKINPYKGRAKITFRIKPLENSGTSINGVIQSYYSDLIFPVVLYGISISIMTLTVILSANYGIEWIIYITGFFIVVTSFIIFFQKHELKNVERELMNYFENIITMKS